jgi:mRNA interferase MazF
VVDGDTEPEAPAGARGVSQRGVPVLNNVVVAPITTTIRNIPTCIPVGPDEGIDHESVATFDNLAAVPKSVLTRRLGTLGPDGRRRPCAALDALADC